MSFIPQRLSVSAPPATGASITGGGSVSGRVAYFDSNTTITGDSTFTFDGTTVQARGLAARYDNNGVTRLTVRNDNAGASAFTQLKLSTDAGDFNINANSIAAGTSVQLTADGTFTGGMQISVLGNNTLSLRTNGDNGITVNGSQLVTIGASGGTQIHRINGDTGTAGAVTTYLKLNVNGTEYRVPLHATA